MVNYQLAVALRWQSGCLAAEAPESVSDHRRVRSHTHPYIAHLVFF